MPPTESHLVLVVDDHHDTADALALLLRWWGHEVIVAYDGVSALEAARARAPGVVLLDIAMPGLDGHQLARLLRADAGTQHARLFALSGMMGDEDRCRSLEAGCDLHLVKPLDPTELRALLDAASSPPA
jgi:two-component system CheB/CheR fusion protein